LLAWQTEPSPSPAEQSGDSQPDKSSAGIPSKRLARSTASTSARKVPPYERFSCTAVKRSRRHACIVRKVAEFPRVAYVTWYGDSFRGLATTSGEIFIPEKFTAASRSLPFGTILRVTNLRNGRRVVVRVNDRGPWRTKCALDLSLGAARSLHMVSAGLIRAKIEILDVPSLKPRRSPSLIADNLHP
jgi:rare lipoprotein A